MGVQEGIDTLVIAFGRFLINAGTIAALDLVMKTGGSCFVQPVYFRTELIFFREPIKSVFRLRHPGKGDDLVSPLLVIRNAQCLIAIFVLYIYPKGIHSTPL